MQVKKRFVNGLVFALTAALLTAATGPWLVEQETAADRAAREGILLIGNGAEPQSLDPHIISGNPEIHIVRALFEGLVDLDPKTMQPVAAAAQSWTVSPDQTVYTFRLRAGAKWSNGDALTARDFVYGWRRVLSPALASNYAYLLYCVKNAEKFHKGEIKDFAAVGVKATDDGTLQVELNAPTPYFLAMLNMPCWFPANQAAIEKFGAIDLRGTKWTRPENLVCNGPFVLKTWQPDKMIEAAKNPLYWDARAIRLNGIRFFPIASRQTEERMFRMGEIHVTESVPINKIPVYQRAKDERLRIDPYLGIYYYRFNVKRAPLTDVRIRRALAMAVDREAIVKFVLKGGQKPAGNFTPPDTAGYTCKASIPYDVAAARKLLAKAGHPDGRGLPPVELLYNTDESHKTVAEAIQQMWKKDLNVDVQLVNQDWKVYLDAMDKLDYSMARAGWIGDYIDPSTFLECWTTNSGANHSAYSNSRYDDLVGRAARAKDQAERCRLYQEAESILLQDAPFVPIYFYTRVYLKSPTVKGWQPNLVGLVAYRQLYLDAQKSP